MFGLFSHGLPHTPPMKAGADASLGVTLGLDALAVLVMFVLCFRNPERSGRPV